MNTENVKSTFRHTFTKIGYPPSGMTRLGLKLCSIAGIIICAQSSFAQNTQVTFNLKSLQAWVVTDTTTTGDATLTMTALNDFTNPLDTNAAPMLSSFSNNSGIHINNVILPSHATYGNNVGIIARISFSSTTPSHQYRLSSVDMDSGNSDSWHDDDIFEFFDSNNNTIGTSAGMVITSTESDVTVPITSSYKIQDGENIVVVFRDVLGNNPNTVGEHWSSLTVTQIVPEPSTYALIFGFLSLAFVFVRKRRTKEI